MKKLTETALNNLSQSSEGIKNPALNPSVQNLSGIDFLNKLLPNLISLSFIIGAIIFVAIIIVGAIQWIISGGDKAGIESARSKITNAVFGLVILLSLFAIVYLIENFFGIHILNLDINFFE